MYQFLSLAVAFICLFLMLRKRVDFGVSICVAAVILGALTAGGPSPFFNQAVAALTKKSSLETMAAVLFVGILSGVCAHYGILDKIVTNLKLIIANPRIILMLVPAIIGLLPVPGGASMSMPFVDTLAEEYQVPAERKGAINIVFRHAGMLLMPFSTTVILVLNMVPSISYTDLASRMLFFVAGNIILGYIYFLRDVPSRQAEPPQGDRAKGLMELLLNLSPILAVVVVTFAFSTPIYISVAVGIFLAFLISDKKDFLSVLVKKTNLKLMLTIAGINMMQGFIQNLDQVIATLTGSLGTGATALIAYALTSLFLSLITGTSMTPLGIVLPLVVAMPQSQGMLLAGVFLILASSYMGYFFSPLHLCQVLTLDYLKCSTQSLYKEYGSYVAALAAVAVGGYALFSFMG